MADLLHNKGEVAVITLPNQHNHQERTQGFQDTIKTHYPAMRVVDIKDGKGDQVKSKQAALELMRAHPDLKGIFATEANGGVGIGRAVIAENKLSQVKIIGFDTDKGTLDMVDEGVISATLAQGTWNMGYWSLQFLFHLHHGLTVPGSDSNSNSPPVPTYVDTGITVVTKKNVDEYYAR